jgi:hypothetical protein
MEYTNFQIYPINVLGIDETYNDELNAIEQVVIDELDYTGDADDLELILPYFVFYKFCENKESDVTAQTGEMAKVAEFSVPSRNSMIRAWNVGVTKLNALCITNSQTVNAVYRCTIDLACGFIL